MKVRYASNNSGGSWWLTDKDWHKLEAAGWEVEWYKDQPKEKYQDGRFLGALATYATIECETPGDAMRMFEEITGEKVSDEGCGCCGAPHSFSWGRAIDYDLPKDAEYGYVSGEDCLQYLFPDKPRMSLREMYES
jgi:hypothetical protein